MAKNILFEDVNKVSVLRSNLANGKSITSISIAMDDGQETIVWITSKSGHEVTVDA